MNIIKMRPSHIPVISSMIKIFNPDTVVECGCGLNSTPRWSAGCKSVTGIEHNQEWIDLIKDKVGSNVNFIVKKFGNLTFCVYPKKLDAMLRHEIYDWYCALNITKTGLLFVDSFAGTRVYSLIALSQKSEIVMYHDTENKKYWYKAFEDKLPIYYPNGFQHWSYRPRVNYTTNPYPYPNGQPDGYRFIERQEPCTDIIFRPEHYNKIKEFENVLRIEHCKYYWNGAGIEFVRIG